MNQPFPDSSPSAAKRRWERVVPRLRNRVRALPPFMAAIRVPILANFPPLDVAAYSSPSKDSNDSDRTSLRSGERTIHLPLSG